MHYLAGLRRFEKGAGSAHADVLRRVLILGILLRHLSLRAVGGKATSAQMAGARYLRWRIRAWARELPAVPEAPEAGSRDFLARPLMSERGCLKNEMAQRVPDPITIC